MAAKFDLLKSAKGQFRFNLKAGNGHIILTSEHYTSKAGAENGVRSVKTNATNDERFERKTSKSNEPYFVLKAGNGQVIGTSEMYSSLSAMEKGIDSVKRNAPDAEVSDLTELAL